MPNNDEVNSLLDMVESEGVSMTKKERTRFKIMASAAEVFNEKGFSEASIQDIANNAGVAKGTIYYYVDKKEDLLVMLVQFGQARLFSKIEKGIARATSASGKIEAIVRNHLKVVKIVGPIFPFFIQNVVVEDSKLREAIGILRKRYLGLLASVIDEGIASGEFRRVDSEKFAVAIAGMIIGQLMQHKVFKAKINAKEIADTTLDLVLNSLKVKHED